MSDLTFKDITRTPRKVRHTKTGATGWAIKYGAADFGSIRHAIFETKDDALDACVSKLLTYHPDFIGTGEVPDFTNWQRAS